MNYLKKAENLINESLKNKIDEIINEMMSTSYSNEIKETCKKLYEEHNSRNTYIGALCILYDRINQYSDSTIIFTEAMDKIVKLTNGSALIGDTMKEVKLEKPFNEKRDVIRGYIINKIANYE